MSNLKLNIMKNAFTYTFIFISDILKLANYQYKAEHRRKFFGILWKYLNPLIFMAIYTLIFSALTLDGKRGFVITMGILIFSGITNSLNGSTQWIFNHALINFITVKNALLKLFLSKVLFNFLPVFYLLPVIVFVQSIFFNIDYQFSFKESLIILLFSYLLNIICLIYTFIICVPTSILAKQFIDLQDLIPHGLRIILYLSPILWVAESSNLVIDTIIKISNPFYFIFDILNLIIDKDYSLNLISFIFPLIILLFSFYFFFYKSRYIAKIRDSILYE